MHRWCSVTVIFSRFGEQLHRLIYPNKLEVMILLIFESLLLVITVTFILILTTEEDEKKQQTRWLPIVNFPLNIPAAPVFDVYISQLILYSSGYAQWSDFQWDQLPTQDLLKKPTLLLCWTHRYKHSTVVITNWLPIANYQFFRCLLMFSLPHKCFLSSITDTTFIWLDNVRWVRVVNPFFFRFMCFCFCFVYIRSVSCVQCCYDSELSILDISIFLYRWPI